MLLDFYSVNAHSLRQRRPVLIHRKTILGRSSQGNAGTNSSICSHDAVVDKDTEEELVDDLDEENEVDEVIAKVPLTFYIGQASSSLTLRLSRIASSV